MADNNRNHGYRANDPYGRPRAEPAAGDPLAELARLIGQQNESAPSYRQSGAPAGGYDQGQGGDGWSQPAHDPYAQPDSYDAQGHSQPAAQSGYGRASHDPRYADPRYAEQNYEASPPYGDSMPGSYSNPRYSDSSQQNPGYGDPRYADPNGYEAGYPDPQGYSDPRYAASSYDGQGYDPSSQGGYAQESYPQGGYSQDSYSQDSGYGNMPSFARAGGQPSGYPDPYYDGAPRTGMHRPAPEDHAPARRRGSIVTVLAVLALAVVGTAAAFGYRAMFGSSGTAVPPPVIRADPRPSKVVPVASDPNAKPIQDRIGGSAERVVPREEAPVDPSRGSNPRVIFPNLAEQQGQKPAVVANIGSTGSASVVGPAEPKKIRTVAIKPEHGAARNAPPAVDAEAARAQANSPLTLAPNAPAPAAAPPQRHAARPSTNGVAAPFPAPVTSNASAIAGGYAVQVTSQRSEADAQASFKSLQSQFPSVLGSRQPVIRKADLGDKGTYYRAQIPFSSQTEASDFCSSLKAAGGQCVVQKN